MKNFIIPILTYFLCTTAIGQISTEYRWNIKGDLLSQGRCFEIDSETNGKKYIAPVDKKFCKPSRTVYRFNKKRGNCIEVDEVTEGKNFYSKVSKDHCKTKNLTLFKGIINGAFGCFEIDGPSNGDNYFSIVEDKKCEKLNVQYYWQVDEKDSNKGRCYTKDISGKISSVRARFCKPESTVFKFVRTDPLKGKCFEQHFENPNLYSDSVPIENCKVQNTVFVFFKDENQLKGNCFEIDEETKGNQYLAKVKPGQCKE